MVLLVGLAAIAVARLLGTVVKVMWIANVALATTHSVNACETIGETTLQTTMMTSEIWRAMKSLV